MRILVLNQYFRPDQASSAQLLTELCEDLAQAHTVTVVCGRPSYNVATTHAPSREVIHGVRVRRVWSTTFRRHSMLGRISNYLTFLTTVLLGGLRAGRPDVIMAWTDPPPIGAVAAVIARLRRVPLVLTMQDVVPEAIIEAGELSNPIMIKGLRWAREFGCSRAKAVVAIGDDMRAALVRLGVDDDAITVIPNWSDGSLVKPLDGPNPFRSEHGWDDETFVIMHSGNLGMGQDLAPLLEALAEAPSDPTVRFAIVGEGMRKEHWQSEVHHLGLEHVTFLPFQPKEALPRSLGAADIHLLSHTVGMEGYQVPSKLYGILAAGKPVLALTASEADVARTVTGAGCGIVVDPGDQAGIIAALTDLRDPATRARMGAAARKVFEERFDRSIATAAYAGLLVRVTQSSPI